MLIKILNYYTEYPIHKIFDSEKLLHNLSILQKFQNLLLFYKFFFFFNPQTQNILHRRKLFPGHSFLYTWENPSGSRVLVWEIGHKKELEDDLRKDEVGEFSPTENSVVYWASFLDGMQRVLLFTTEKSVAEDAQSAKQFEIVQQEINVSIHGLGLSLVNNLTKHEIMYVGIASSGIIWESCKTSSKRFKQMKANDSHLIENAYQQYLARAALCSFPEGGRTVVDAKIEVDFESGLMVKPQKRKIRRTFMTGLWLQMKSSSSQLQLHAKINRLQIDNQMYDCIFPVVLAPVPPPKSVATDMGELQLCILFLNRFYLGLFSTVSSINTFYLNKK